MSEGYLQENLRKVLVRGAVKCITTWFSCLSDEDVNMRKHEETFLHWQHKRVLRTEQRSCILLPGQSSVVCDRAKVLWLHGVVWIRLFLTEDSAWWWFLYRGSAKCRNVLSVSYWPKNILVQKNLYQTSHKAQSREWMSSKANSHTI